MEVSGSKSLYLRTWIFSRSLTLCSGKPDLSGLPYSVKINVVVPIEQEKKPITFFSPRLKNKGHLVT